MSQESTRDSIFYHYSAKAQTQVNSGHEYWLHAALLRAAKDVFGQTQLFALKTLSPNLNSGALHGSKQTRALQCLLPGLFIKRDLKSLSSKMPDNPNSFLHCYEGGFREFLVFAYIAMRWRNVRIIFNFNLIDPWHKISGPAGKFIFATLGKFMREIGPRAIFYAETQELMNVLFEQGLPIQGPYPLFSAAKNMDTVDTKTYPNVRATDFTFFVNGANEQDLSIEALRAFALGQKQKSFAVKVIPRWGSAINKMAFSSLPETIQIEILDQVLNDDEYSALLLSTKVCVLPYLDRYYELGSSGRLLDSRKYGCVSVVSANTAPGNLSIDNRWGPVFEPTANSLSDALDIALKFRVESSKPSFTAADTLKIFLKKSITQYTLDSKESNKGALPKSLVMILLRFLFPISLPPKTLASRIVRVFSLR